MTHRHTDWLNANKYTPEERNKICHDLMGEAQYWDSEQYLRYMHDSTKRPWVGLTEDEFYDLDDVGRKMILEYGRLVEAKLKEKNT
mgnify:CR=1 FL=1